MTEHATTSDDEFRKLVTILAGLSQFEVRLLRQILAAADTQPSLPAIDTSTLSARERTVLKAMLVRTPNKTIALELGISHRTVEKYRSNVLSKLGYRSTMDFVAAVGKTASPYAV